MRTKMSWDHKDDTSLSLPQYKADLSIGSRSQDSFLYSAQENCAVVKLRYVCSSMRRNTELRQENFQWDLSESSCD
jgi:hypothetical protein